MGKGNMLLGRLRKSVGDLTFRVSDGQQLVSAKVKSVRNPKTMNQRTQRAIFATAAQLASSLYPIVNHSWEGQTRTNGSLRAFRKEAIADLRKFYEDGDGLLCLNPKNTMDPEPNQVLVSKGRLGALDVKYNSNLGGVFLVGSSVFGMDDRDNVTFAQLKTAFGIDVNGGDEIAIVTMINRRGVISAQFNRVVLVDGISDTDIVLTSDNHANCGFNPMVIQANKTVGGFTELLLQDEPGGGSIKVAINAANTTLVAAAVVVSHYDTERGMWQYTTSRMGVDASFFASYDNDAAIASYGDAAATVPDSDYFLDQSTAVAGGSSMPGSVAAQLRSGDDVRGEISEGAIGENLSPDWTYTNNPEYLQLNLTFPSRSIPSAWSVKQGNTEIAHSTSKLKTSTQIAVDLDTLTLPTTLTLMLLYHKRGDDGHITETRTTQTISVPKGNA